MSYSTCPNALLGLLSEMSAGGFLALDLETTGLSPLDSKVRLLSVAVQRADPWQGAVIRQKVFVLDAFKTDIHPVVQKLSRYYWDVIIGHNIKFDLKFLAYHYGFKPNVHPFDTFRASWMLHNGKEGLHHDLYAIRERELGIAPGPDLQKSDWSGELTEMQMQYAAEDVSHLYEIHASLEKKLNQNELLAAYDIERRAILAETKMELAGFYLDADRWREVEMKNLAEEARLKAELWEKLPAKQLGLPGIPTGINLNSREEVIQAFKRKGIVLPATDRITMAQVASEYPEVRTFMAYRKASKAVSSFGSDYLKNINPKTGRVHPSYWPLTGAGRYSCSEPNLQQIPADKTYRACFRAKPGHKLIIADYSQIELRILAYLTQDPTLLRIYKEGEDAHTRTASIISNVPMSEVSKAQRQMAKPVNFGLMYGMGPEKLALYSMTNYGVPMSLTQAQTFHKRYFDAYKGVAQWHKEQIRQGRINKYARTASGRIRYLDPETCYSEFFNTPVQGTGADGLKAAMCIFTKDKNRRAKLVHVVHDEMIVECPDELVPRTKDLLVRCMKNAMEELIPGVPIEVDAGVGESWADK